MSPLPRSPLPVLGAAFAAILVILVVMVAGSDSVGRALVARHENEVQLAELIYSGDRLLTRATEQVNTYQDFLRAPAPIRLQLYRAAQQAVVDQLAALRDTAAARPDLAPDVARLTSVADRWDAELGWVSRDGPQPSERVLAEAARLGARADELARDYAEAVTVYQAHLEALRAANRETGQALADLFQLVVRVGGLVGALLVVGVGVVTTLTIRHFVEQLALSRWAIVQAQEAIRREVAERLHGEVQGKILALELQLRQATDQLARDPEHAERGIREVIERLVVVRDTARAISHQLHPAILRMGLPAALRSLRDGLEPAVTVTLDVAPAVEERELQRSFGGGGEPAAGAVSADVRLVLYRLVQEAVNNAVLHGGVSEVAVRLWSPRPDQLAVSVVDHGRGLGRGTRLGLGLTSLRGALEALGGRLEMGGTPGGGTRVLGVVPVAPRAGAAPRPAPEVAPSVR
jgi:signal transduction histidine kinase